MCSIEQAFIPIQELLQDCFSRVETKLSAMSYFQSVISTIERKNCWQLTEQAGCENPYAFQYLLDILLGQRRVLLGEGRI